ncbi:acyl-CoA dehydrogenase family protein [Natrinema gelatinilyticum]|uniref:acyl-CoA dehydrogenase family protein n=1 Tax=Natrinema gelatinilyticum TaxID=2961571 RepID=UPI0020C56B85|nr:acyl-CoA dehydrogenase family protein [Natrinema gelatinilyticum]
MPFTLTDEQHAIRRAARDFAENEIAPVAREYDENFTYPRDVIETAAQHDFAARTVPAEYGGAGMDVTSSVVVTEELWRADPGIANAIDGVAFATNVSLLERYGDEWMREEWFPKFVSADALAAIAISEPGHGSDIGGIETRAEQDGDEWVLNGAKTWISNGTKADVVIVVAKTDSGEGHRGLSCFLVPTETDGYEAERIENKLGLHASDLADVHLDDMTVPAANLVGEENRGFYHLMDVLAPGRVEVAAQAVGTAQAALDAAISYATQREQFNRPISEFQAIRHSIAEMETAVEAARSLTYRAAARCDEGANDATRIASAAKLFASERAVEVADDAVQIHGGAGYVTDFPAERYYRDARALPIFEGTSEIQKNVIAKGLL